MMTLEEIRTAKINPVIAREAYEQASKRLEDTLDTKKAYEQKAFTLFSGYVTVSLALFGVGGAIFKDQGLTQLVTPFWISGLLYITGAICFVTALVDTQYGALASHPNMWLNKGILDGDDSILPLMMSYITFYHQERIDTSVASNERKAIRIRIGIGLGVAGPILLFLWFTLPSVLMWLEPLFRKAP